MRAGRRRRFAGGGTAASRAVLPILALGVTALFFAQVVASVIGPAYGARRLSLRLQSVRARYVAEGVFLRALGGGVLAPGRVVEVREGDLSLAPRRLATVTMRRSRGVPQVVCRLERAGGPLVFVANYSRGVLAPSVSWALGQGEPGDLGDGVAVRGVRGTLSRDTDSADVHPFSIPGAWAISPDLRVRAKDFRKSSRGTNANLGNFRLAPELPLAVLSEPTELDDFALGRSHGERLVAAFRSNKNLVVRVHGHLWAGEPGRTLLVGTGGRSLVLLVSGNVYVQGSIDLLGPDDRLTLVAGRPDWGAFRDTDLDGSRDAGEVALSGPREPSPLTPHEGAGVIYVGRGETRAHVQATLIANHDVIVGPAGASIEGACLAGGRVVRTGTTPGPLSLAADPRFPDHVPVRGLPILPATEKRERVTAIRAVLSGGDVAVPAAPR